MHGVLNRFARLLVAAGLMSCGLLPSSAQLLYRQIRASLDYTMGNMPQGALIEGSDGLLYGTMSTGGLDATNGTVFRVNKDGSGYMVLWQFNGPPGDGSRPIGGVVQGSDSALYGTTFAGGVSNLGAVFKLTSTGSGTYSNQLLKSFTGVSGDGANPSARLLLGSDGWLYGTTTYGGGGSNSGGTVFKLRTDGTGFTNLWAFSDTTSEPRFPFAGLVQGTNGLLYGTTFIGGTNFEGTVYGLTTNGTGHTVLKHFRPSGVEAYNPYAGLACDSNNVLYGVTPYGGSGAAGTVFRLNADGSSYAVLTNFTGASGNAPGSRPSGTLLIAADGLLYGTTTDGGTNNLGTVFRLNKNGTGYTVLWNFAFSPPDNLDGANPLAGLVQGSDGGFYGTTTNGGAPPFSSAYPSTIFSLGPRPVNDAFVTRIPLAGTAAIGQGNNLNATLEANEPLHGSPTSPGTNSVWWSWSGLSNGPVTIANDTPMNSIIDVYRGTTGSCTAMPAGLINWWPGEGNANDSVGGADGTLLNGAGFAPGKVGQAFSFAGTLSPTGNSQSNRMQIGASPIPPPWTAEFWVNRQNCLTNSAVLLNDSNVSLKLEQYNGTRQVGFTTWGNKDYSFSYIAPVGTWVHLVFVASSTNVALYTNGVFQSSLAATNINLPRGQIGNDIAGRYERPLRGLVDEVSLYNRMLLASEIVSLYNAGAAGKCLPKIASSAVSVRFDNNTQFPIPDNNPAGASSPIVVSNFFGVLGKVTVSLFVSHFSPSDLTIQLISPDGVTNVLAANASGGGFGDGCLDVPPQRTTFDDFATNALSATIGNFRPQQPLSVFAGKSGASANGVWQLRVVDQVAGNVGNIECWSLTLTPVEPPYRVSFTPDPGATYQIAVSGVINPGNGPYAAGSGNISLSMRTLNLKILSVTPAVNPASLTTAFSTVVQIGNGRAVAAGPLRLQFVAKPGFSALETDTLPSSLPPSQVLTNYYLANPSTVAAGATTNVSVANLVCPAPTNYLGAAVGWGVLAYLQQQAGTNWLTQDSELVLHGVWPEVGGFNGPGGGVIRIDPVGGGAIPLSRVRIIGTNAVIEGSTNYYYGEADFDAISYTHNFTNTVWTSSLPAIDGGGVFTPGIVTNTSQATLTCYYTYDTTSSASLLVWVTNLPPPSLINLARLTNKQFQFTVKGVPGRKQVIQAATNLANPINWTNLATVTNNGSGTATYTDSGATNLTRRFYRAYETP